MGSLVILQRAVGGCHARAAVLPGGRHGASSARTRLFDPSAPATSKFGTKAITSQLLLIGEGRSGAQSERAFQQELSFKIDLSDILASIRLPNASAGARSLSGGLLELQGGRRVLLGQYLWDARRKAVVK